MDYFWLFVPVWAGFGALLTGIVLRRLDISRMSYREARQMLSVMVVSLSKRMQHNEELTRELSEQLDILNAKQSCLGAEEPAAKPERPPEYTRDWTASATRFIDRLDGFQENLKGLEHQFQELRVRVDKLAERQQVAPGNGAISVGVVTEEGLSRLSETEMGVLRLLFDGPKSASEIGRLLRRSREHTGRLMKSLFEQGFVERETASQPYAYCLNQKVRDVMGRNVVQELSRSEQ